MESVEKVYPTAEELCKSSKNQSCPECCAIFNSDSNLNLHLAKTHKKPHFLQSSKTTKIFHCPQETCNYHNVAHFKSLKALRQHYRKVHSERKFICSLCQKGFPTEATCNRHEKYCNIDFKCCDCEMSYNCYETLKTHGRRKKHSVMEKSAYKPSTSNTLKTQKSEESIPTNKMRLLLPKPSSSVDMIIITGTSEQSCQTEKSNRNSQKTQTLLACRMPHFTVETQTIGDYFTRKPESFSSNLKSAKTQTATANPKTAACNTSFSLDDLELGSINLVQRNSSSTQTTIDKEEPREVYPATTQGSIHTDTSDLLTETLDSNFFNCNSETQTDFIFNDELFKYCEDYTNMCTQTCDDLLLGEIGFNDTHTQTVFDDVLKSVESQTIMSQSRVPPLSCKDNVTHMETQTENYFKQMLEEINA